MGLFDGGTAKGWKHQKRVRGRFAKGALAAALACSLAPVSSGAAWADESSSAIASGAAASSAALATGTYAEHEAIALVSNVDALAARSRGVDALSSAEPLMTVSTAAAVRMLDAAGEEPSGAFSAAYSAIPQAASADGADAAANETTADNAQFVLVRDETRTTEQLIADLESDPRVVFAEPNYTVEQPAPDETGDAAAYDGTSVSPEADDASADGAFASATADDASASPEPNGAVATDVDLTPWQWEYNNDGTFGGSGTAGIDMGYDGWNGAQGAAADGPIVAILDTGVDAANPDLASKMWVDDGSVPALAQMGGDEHGISFEPDATGNRTKSYANFSSGHGTHVAGIVGAAWNGVGVSGYAQDACLMSLRFGGDLSTILQCFEYVKVAIAGGQPVVAVNNSWTLGATQSQAVNVAVGEVGRAGAVSVFGSANSMTDMDNQAMTAGLLRGNPYAVTVGSIDSTGAASVFTNYGKATTDVMTPGSSILSTWPSETPNYLGEADADAVLYESFDAESRAGAAVPEGTAIAFESESGVTTVADGKRFTGDAAVSLPYAPSGDDVYNWAKTEPVDLSAVAEGARYLSIRYAVGQAPAEGFGASELTLAVRTTDGAFTEAPLQGEFRAWGDAWGGAFIKLPDNTDFTHFQLNVGYANLTVDMTGGERVITPVTGSVLVDGIALGDGLVPYQVNQGTSMAGPAATGVVAELASRYPSDSAEQRAARARGIATGRQGLAWYYWCATGCMPDLAQAGDPAPVITRVADNGDGTLAVEGWFLGDDAAVAIDGRAATVLSSAAVDGSDGAAGKRTITVQPPASFTGGEVEVTATRPDGAHGRFFVALGNSAVDALYDQVNLPLPEGIEQWPGWKLAGFDGDLYCLPTYDFMAGPVGNVFMRYDAAARAWERVAVPDAALEEVGIDPSTFQALTAATFGGSLVFQVTGIGSDGVPTTAYLALGADGAWSVLAKMGTVEGDVPLGTLGSDGKSLYTFGGFGFGGAASGESAAVNRVDLATGTATMVGELQRPRVQPNVAWSEGCFLVAGGTRPSLQVTAAMGVDRVQIGSDGAVEVTPVDTSSVVTETGQLVYGVAGVQGGFMLAGPENIAGTADTYTLAADEGAQPVPYGKRASSLTLQSTAACAYRSTLYVLAGLTTDPYRTFSATAVETAAQPGDVPETPEPEPTPEPQPEPAPEPEPGPADPAVDANAGNTTAKSLARTGDDAPLAPIAIAGAAAAVVAGSAAVARRRMRK